jgi:hypothetical protein
MGRLRRRWFLCGFLLLLLLAVAIWLIAKGSRRVTRVNFERIRIGMMQQEVNDLLGNENAWRRGFATSDQVLVLDIIDYCQDDGSWLFPGDTIRVEFRRQGNSELCVSSKEFRPVTTQDAWQRVRDRVEYWVGL